MKTILCDRCGADTTKWRDSAHIKVNQDNRPWKFDLCGECYHDVLGDFEHAVENGVPYREGAAAELDAELEVAEDK